MNALQSSKACDVTGIVAMACGRHGCYVPNSIVDMFKGEQQKIVDFSLLKSIIFTHLDPDQGLLLIYDIICQYIIYLLERIGTHLPMGLVIEAAIGLFHVHAHKDECFFRYASSFIPGAGIIAGEILESLWSTLNAISPAARTATLAHRAEMLDDHASDSNHKKMLGIVTTLCKSNTTAIDMLEHAKTYYDNLTSEAGSMAVDKWTDKIKDAEDKRQCDIKAMDIYAAKNESAKGKNVEPDINHHGTALQLWMELSLTIEEKQYVNFFCFIIKNKSLLNQNQNYSSVKSTATHTCARKYRCSVYREGTWHINDFNGTSKASTTCC